MSTPTIASGAGVTSSCVVLSAVLAALAVNHLPLERLVIAQHGLFSAGDLWVQHPSPASRGDAAGAEAADVAVVLGYSVEEDGAPTPPLVARVELGVRLFASGAARNLMFSGAAGEDATVRMTEAEAMRKLAAALAARRDGSSSAASCASEPSSGGAGSGRRCGGGALGLSAPVPVPASASPHPRVLTDRRGSPLRVREVAGRGEKDDAFTWVLEESSTSTRENALFSLEACARRGWRDVVVVTNRFHQFRSARVFRAAAAEMVARAEAEDEPPVTRVRVAHMPPELELRTQFPPVGSGAAVRARELWRAQWNILRELGAVALYAWRGWL